MTEINNLLDISWGIGICIFLVAGIILVIYSIKSLLGIGKCPKIKE